MTVKILFNSVMSTPGRKLMTIDITYFYLNTPLERPEFIRLKISKILEDVIKVYKLRDKADSKISYMSRSQKACMDYPMQESLPRSC